MARLTLFFVIVAALVALSSAQVGAKYKVVVGNGNPQPKAGDLNPFDDTKEATKGGAGGAMSSFKRGIDKRDLNDAVPLHVAARGLKGGAVEPF